MHMAITAIPHFLEFGIEGSIKARRGGCQDNVWRSTWFPDLRSEAAAALDFSEQGAMSCTKLSYYVILPRMTRSSPSRRSRVFTVSFPEDLAKQVEAVAKAEGRNISELFREAFRAYRMERNEQKLVAARAEAAKRGPVRYTEDDVEALVDEVRRELARKKRTA